MNKRIALEPNLSNYRDQLQSAGYDIVSLDGQNVNGQGLSAIVISGTDQNVMGIQDTTTKCPVINAHGMSPQDLVKRLEGINNNK